MTTEAIMKIRIYADGDNIGKRARDARLAKGYTITQVAAAMNLSSTALNNIEKEHLEAINLSQVRKLEKILETSLFEPNVDALM